MKVDFRRVDATTHILYQVGGEVGAIRQVLAQILRQHCRRLPVRRHRLLTGGQWHVGDAKVDTCCTCNRDSEAVRQSANTRVTDLVLLFASLCCMAPDNCNYPHATGHNNTLCTA